NRLRATIRLALTRACQDYSLQHANSCLRSVAHTSANYATLYRLLDMTPFASTLTGLWQVAMWQLSSIPTTYMRSVAAVLSSLQSGDQSLTLLTSSRHSMSHCSTPSSSHTAKTAGPVRQVAP